jgi:hypothetical protein
MALDGTDLSALWAAKYEALLTTPANGAQTDMTVEMAVYIQGLVEAADQDDVPTTIYEDLKP